MIVANWKMNIATSRDAERLSSEIGRALWKLPEEVEVALCPPALWLQAVRPERGRAPDGISVGAQNIHPEVSGAFTGEMSAEMASDLGEYVIVGHSERRALFGETDELVAAKAAAAVRAGLSPILCVGEPESVRDAGDAERYVAAQLDAGLASIASGEGLNGVVVAYEPVWAIGTGRAATPELAQDMIGGLRESLRARAGGIADDTPFLYGGSVNADNIADYVQRPDVDGALVGSASLDAESFVAIVRGAMRAAGIRYVPESGPAG